MQRKSLVEEITKITVTFRYTLHGVNPYTVIYSPDWLIVQLK